MSRQKGVCEILTNAILYDTIYFEAGKCYTYRDFFTSPVGVNFPGTKTVKTFAHTNSCTGGFLPGINSFTIDHLYIMPRGLSRKEDLKNLLKGTGVLLINQKPYPSRWPIETYLGFVVFDVKKYAEGILDEGALTGDEEKYLEADDESLRYYKEIKDTNLSRFSNPGFKDVTIDTLENCRVELAWDSPGFTPKTSFFLMIKMFGEFRREVC